MKDRYFSVEVKPTISAAKQHEGVFSAGDVLFDWVEFEIPKGSSRLIGASMITRPQGAANPTGNKFGAFLVFSKTNTQTYGVENGLRSYLPTNDLLGMVEFEDTTSYTTGAGTHIGMTGRTSNTASNGGQLVLTGSQTGSNVGYDKLYMAAEAAGAFNFTSINVINDADINSTTPTAIVMAGTSMDVRQHFLPGDVLHAQDDTLLGTVASIDDNATGPINLTSATSGAGDATTVTNGDTIYNIHPIRVILHFEK